jgi:DNA-binding MarR family transcriptional regulator
VPPDFSVPQEFLVDRMRDIFLATAAELSVRLKATGFYAPTATQIAVMSQIPPSGIRVVDLAKKAGVTKQAIHQMADQLVGAGVLQRVPDPRDGRAKLLRPTPYAAKAYAVSRRILTEIHSEWRLTLGDDGYVSLERSLSALQKHPRT